MEPKKSSFNLILIFILLLLFLLSLAVPLIAEWSASQVNASTWMFLLNALILSIPLVLLYGSLYVLILGWRQHYTAGQINPRLARVIHWAPRVAAMLIILFVSLFSLDVFEATASPLKLVGAFLMHSIPSLIMLVLLVMAWKRPAVGFLSFLATAILFTVFFVRGFANLYILLLFVLPILLVALLFYADWKWVEPPSSAPTDGGW